ncbi:MAG: hypothetical protein WDO74_31110 [Pseudomonadota bacterium]
MNPRSARVHFVALSLLSLSACQPAAAPPRAAADGPALLGAVPSSLAQKPCSPTGPELCFNATDDNCNGIIDEGCGLHTGLVQFAIAWEEPRADVDLRLFDPSGELIEVGRTARSGLVKERDCPGRNNECHGQNLENVYLSEGEPLRGEYRVRIRLEALGGENPPSTSRLARVVGPKTYSQDGFSRRARGGARTALPLVSEAFLRPVWLP